MIHSLSLPGKVIMGREGFHRIPELVRRMRCKKVCIITDSVLIKLGSIQELETALKNIAISVAVFSEISAEPTFSLLEKLCSTKRYLENDLIIAVGGGSVIDTAKGLSAAIANPGFAANLRDATQIREKGVPMIAVPTTAGTGAEATPNAILFDEKSRTKIGIVSPNMIPETVVLDSDMTKTLPVHIAAVTGFDALAHALESYLSKKCNPFTETFAVEAVRLIVNNIEKACGSNDEGARQSMLLAAFYAGSCLVTASTHIVHALAYPLAGDYHVSHGQGVSLLLLPVLSYLQECCAEKLCRLSGACFNKTFKSDEEGAVFFLEHLQGIADRLHMNKKLSEYGVREKDIEKMATEAIGIRRLMDNAPMEMSVEKAMELYKNEL